MIVGVITGDIINSRKVESSIWLPLLENALKKYAPDKKSREIFRGDSFQLEVSIEKVIEAFVYIKSSIRTVRPLDVRMSIGIGKKAFQGDTISKSNGEAFIFSGEAFEELKKQNISIKTPWVELTEELKLILNLMAFIIEKWNVNYSETVQIVLNNKESTQLQVAETLNKKQSQISRELKKAGFDEIHRSILFCTKKILSLC